MDHRDIEERQVVDRYLMGRLPAEEAERFEEHYLHCQECLDQLEVAERLQRGFKRTAAEEAARVAAVGRLGVVAWLVRAARSHGAGLAAAALLVAMVPTGLLIRERSRAFEPRINTTVVAMSPERSAPLGGAEPTHRIRLSGASEWLVLSLELDRPQYGRYSVALLRGGGEELWRRDGLEPDRQDSLVLSLHSSWLAAGDYLARVEGVPPAGEPVPVAHFRFRVAAAD